MKAFEIDSYAQGARFSDESDFFYDSTAKSFKDLSGYSDLGNNNVDVKEGSPVFNNAGVNARRGLFIDGTMYADFFTPNAWNGTIILVVNYSYLAGGTVGDFLYISGDATLGSSNASVVMSHFSGNRIIRAVTAASQVVAPDYSIREDGTTVVYAFSFDQNTRRAYSTTDGITVSQSSEYTANAISGDFLAWGGGVRTRVGNLSGDTTNNAASTKMEAVLFEQHCFTDNILLTDLAKVKLLIDDLKEYYGVS